MTTGSGDLQRPLRAFLALDVLEIESGSGGGGELRLGRRQQLGGFVTLTSVRAGRGVGCQSSC